MATRTYTLSITLSADHLPPLMSEVEQNSPNYLTHTTYSIEELVMIALERECEMDPRNIEIKGISIVK